jgi:O-antigen/teichoic acid export membrane protein
MRSDSISTITRRGKLQTGAQWLSLSGAFIGIAGLLQIAILARLIYPDDFGTMTMLLVVAGAINVIQDLSTSSAIISIRNITDDDITSLFGFNLLLGVFFSIIILLSAAAINLVFKSRELETLLYWLIPYFFVSPLVQFLTGLSEREFFFRGIALAEVLAFVANASVTVSLAFLGWGVRSLVLGLTASIITRAIFLIWLNRPVLRSKFQSPKNWRLRRFLAFGLYNSGQKLINYISGNLDFMVIGNMLGASPLGHYSMSFNLANVCATRIIPVLSRVFYPTLAKSREDGSTKEFESAYLEAQELISTISFGFGAFLYLFSKEIIDLWLGENWNDSAILLQYLAIYAAIRGAGATIGQLLLITAESRKGFCWSLLYLMVQAPTILLSSIYFGVTGIAMAYALIASIFIFLSYPLLVARISTIAFKNWLFSLARPICLSLLSAFMVHEILNLCSMTNTLAFLILGAFLFLGIDVLLMSFFQKSTLRLALSFFVRT